MKISHGTQISEQSDKNGYGYATSNMLASLNRLGYEVNQNDATADVEIWFDQPHHWKWSKNVYRIGYHPWESTQLLNREWEQRMNECDEIWTPSPLIAKWYTQHMNIKVPVFVYEHGVDPIWQPKKRTVDGTFKFFHMGSEALRKGGKEAMQGLRLAFPRNEDVQLNMKVISKSKMINILPRVHLTNQMCSLEELIQMFYDNHVYVYPSWGEGFGLTPIQAMATGMPTITLPAWAPYAEHLLPNLSVQSRLVKSPWPAVHPGAMFQPNMDSLIESMREVYHNYDHYQERSHARVDKLMAYYDWDSLTAEAFGSLEKRLENL